MTHSWFIVNDLSHHFPFGASHVQHLRACHGLFYVVWHPHLHLDWYSARNLLAHPDLPVFLMSYPHLLHFQDLVHQLVEPFYQLCAAFAHPLDPVDESVTTRGCSLGGQWTSIAWPQAMTLSRSPHSHYPHLPCYSHCMRQIQLIRHNHRPWAHLTHIHSQQAYLLDCFCQIFWLIDASHATLLLQQHVFEMIDLGELSVAYFEMLELKNHCYFHYCFWLLYCLHCFGYGEEETRHLLEIDLQCIETQFDLICLQY